VIPRQYAAELGETLGRRFEHGEKGISFVALEADGIQLAVEALLNRLGAESACGPPSAIRVATRWRAFSGVTGTP
jgi:hypothetical protein